MTVEEIRFTTADGVLQLRLSSGRIVAIATRAYPRLRGAPLPALCNVRVVGEEAGLHWPDLHEVLRLPPLDAHHPSSSSG